MPNTCLAYEARHLLPQVEAAAPRVCKSSAQPTLAETQPKEFEDRCLKTYRTGGVSSGVAGGRAGRSGHVEGPAGHHGGHCGETPGQ
jgi:hypothetical protein